MNTQKQPPITPDALDFQPDDQEIRQARLPWWGRLGILWLGGFFLLAFAWACLGKVDVIVVAKGRVVSREPTIVMKPLERTVIKSIPVAIGDRVAKGDVLATFDPAFSTADNERLTNEIRILSAQFARLTAEFRQVPYTLPSAAMEAETWQHSIFCMRNQYYQEKIRYFTLEIQRIEDHCQALITKEKQLASRLATYTDIEKIYLKGLKSNATSLVQIKEVQISRMQAHVDLHETQNQIALSRIERVTREAERNAFIEEWRTKTAEEMVHTRQELVRAQKEYEKVAQLQSYVELRSPVAAMVHEIAAISVGSAVREAESLVTLVPLGGELELEGQVEAQDIGRVRLGDAARIKLTAFPFQVYGTATGTVRVISEDAFTRQPQEMVRGTTEAAYYRVRLTVTEGLRGKDGQPVHLLPGMEAQVEIRTGRRRIIEYVTHPLIRAFDEAGREP